MSCSQKRAFEKKGGLGGFAPQTLTRSYYFEPPLSKKRSRATACDRLFTLVVKFLHAPFWRPGAYVPHCLPTLRLWLIVLIALFCNFFKLSNQFGGKNELLYYTALPAKAHRFSASQLHSDVIIVFLIGPTNGPLK